MSEKISILGQGSDKAVLAGGLAIFVIWSVYFAQFGHELSGSSSADTATVNGEDRQTELMDSQEQNRKAALDPYMNEFWDLPANSSFMQAYIQDGLVEAPANEMMDDERAPDDASDLALDRDPEAPTETAALEKEPEGDATATGEKELSSSLESQPSKKPESPDKRDTKSKASLLSSALSSAKPREAKVSGDPKPLRNEPEESTAPKAPPSKSSSQKPMVTKPEVAKPSAPKQNSLAKSSWPKHLQDAIDEYNYFRPSRLSIIVGQIGEYFKQQDQRPFELEKLRQDARSYLAVFHGESQVNTEDLQSFQNKAAYAHHAQQSKALLALAKGDMPELTQHAALLDPSKSPLNLYLSIQAETASNAAKDIAQMPDSQFFPLQMLRVEMLQKLQNHAEAEQLLQSLIQSGENHTKLKQKHLASIEAQGKWKQLEAQAQTYSEESSDAALTLYWIEALNRNEKFTEALVQLTTLAGETMPQSQDQGFTLWYELGKSQYGLANLQKSIKAFEKARAIMPKSFKVLMNLGSAHYKAGQFIEAIEHFQAAKNLSPMATLPWRYTGMAFLKINEGAEAEKSFENARMLGDESPTLYYHLSKAYQMQNKNAEAQAAIAKIDPNLTPSDIEAELSEMKLELRP